MFGWKTNGKQILTDWIKGKGNIKPSFKPGSFSFSVSAKKWLEVFFWLEYLVYWYESGLANPRRLCGTISQLPQLLRHRAALTFYSWSLSIEVLDCNLRYSFPLIEYKTKKYHLYLEVSQSSCLALISLYHIDWLFKIYNICIAMVSFFWCSVHLENHLLHISLSVHNIWDYHTNNTSVFLLIFWGFLWVCKYMQLGTYTVYNSW